ncbi:MAG: DegV family protein [Christensenellaceae bacterium]|jgi:DegV family protein with EDD domain|nr:DegV family protein [Christensenellaceae bacterium]
MIVIATDSTAYMSAQEGKELGLLYIPMSYSIGEDAFAEGFFHEGARFHGAALSHPSLLHTSQPAMAVIERRFRRFVEAGHEILCLTISSRLSGTFSNASVCAKGFAGRVRVVDSKTAAAGMVILLREARRLVDEGRPLEDCAGELEALAQRVHTLFSVKDLSPLRRSGRLGLMKQSIGTILNQRPILRCEDGAVVSSGLARGRREQLRLLTDPIPESARAVIVQHFSDEAAAAEMAEALRLRLKKPVEIRRIGIVLGIHLSFDVIGSAWLD